MADAAKRFAGPAISFLVGLGFQVSGYTDVRLALVLWAIALIWTIFALLTWDPVRQIIRGRGIQQSVASAERGFLDFLLYAERIPPQMATVLIRMAADTAVHTQKTKAHTQRILEEQARNRPDKTARLHRLASRAAQDMRLHARGMSEHLTALTNLADLLAQSYHGLAPVIRSLARSETELQALRTTLTGFLQILSTGVTELEGYREVVFQSRGTSQDLNEAASEMIVVIDGTLSVMETMRAASATLIEGATTTS